MMTYKQIKKILLLIILVMLIFICPTAFASNYPHVEGAQDQGAGSLGADHGTVVVPYNVLDIEQATIDRAVNHLAIPTYDGSGQCTHPSVWCFSEKWQGYHYWMAMTPYPNSNDQLENPSIVVSNDGEIWSVPVGLTNPIIDQPASGYNSDPNLFYENGTLYLVYRYVDMGKEYIYVCSSKDGIIWIKPVLIIQINTANERMLSPCLVKIDGRYAIYSIDMKPSPNVLKMRTSDSITGGWSSGKTIPGVAIPGEDIWHFEIIGYDDYYLMLLQQSKLDNNGGAQGQLYLGCSLNGIDWKLTAKPVLQRMLDNCWDISLYKSAFQPRNDNGELVFDVWYAATTTDTGSGEQWHIGKSVLRFDKDLLINQIKHESRNGAIFFDDFNRPDGALGTRWITTNNMAIIDKKAGAKLFGNNKALTNIGISDYEVTVLVDQHIIDEQYIIVRASDMDNFIRCGRDRLNNFVAQDVKNGLVTNTFIKCLCKPTNGDYLTVCCQGSKISIYINGVLQGQGFSSHNQSKSLIGMQIPPVGNLYDDFSVRTVN